MEAVHLLCSTLPASATGRQRLFDTPRLVRDLEDLYRQMWGDFRRGTLPVPDLHNLDVYHEVGLGLDLEISKLFPRMPIFRFIEKSLNRGTIPIRSGQTVGCGARPRKKAAADWRLRRPFRPIAARYSEAASRQRDKLVMTS